MLYYPRLYSERIFDELFNLANCEPAEHKLYGKRASRLLSTDVREHEDGYELDVDLPGFKKDEINLELEEGYLTISAAKSLDENENDQNGKLIRSERYAGSVSRSFYVGDEIEEDDIKAKFEDGVLSLNIPKKKKELPQKKTILIEG